MQESGGITTKRAEFAKRRRRGGEGSMGGSGGARARGGAASVHAVKFYIKKPRRYQRASAA
ncbi:MAG: hypothetical protein O8C64_02910 [Candidatus Methanoperedens sp.]|nr:hypothetical protein [Candidatus Methanoperedens sp.]MCZ7406509.1 hypothetical protein [Candidatus Methanoperedens sp.]